MSTLYRNRILIEWCAEYESLDDAQADLIAVAVPLSHDLPATSIAIYAEPNPPADEIGAEPGLHIPENP